MQRASALLEETADMLDIASFIFNEAKTVRAPTVLASCKTARRRDSKIYGQSHLLGSGLKPY